jgi:hypothetical protein
MGDGGVPIHGFHILCHVSSPKSQVGVSKRTHSNPCVTVQKQVLCHQEKKPQPIEIKGNYNHENFSSIAPPPRLSEKKDRKSFSADLARYLGIANKQLQTG